MKTEFENTLIKLLYRTVYAMRTVQKCRKIFALHDKRKQILIQFK